MALHQIQSMIRPSTLKEAWKAKGELGESARFVGGGIDVVLYAPSPVTTLIDLAGLGLSGVQKDASGLVIGGTATMTEALESAAVKAYAGGFLIRVLKEVASPLQRNAATFGGTLGSAHPWSDVIPALLVLDAELDVYDGSERTIGLESYLEGRGDRTVPIICAIRLPGELGTSKGAFATFTRTAFDVGLLNVACVGSIGGGAWKDVRIAVGGTPGLAKRLRGVEERLMGSATDDEMIDDASAAAADAIDARDDMRASGEYRRALARALVGRCLAE
ncbi:FAD binding domain-containing protein, partial [Candidatus Bipolaricaulota bacterium]